MIKYYKAKPIIPLYNHLLIMEDLLIFNLEICLLSTQISRIAFQLREAHFI